jgi:hypothetical protein
MKLPAHTSGEQNVSKESFVRIVPLDPTYEAGLRGTIRSKKFEILQHVGCRAEP